MSSSSKSELSLALSLNKTSLLELVISYLDESGQVYAARELEKESGKLSSSSSSSSSTSSLRLKVCKAIASRDIPLARNELSQAELSSEVNPLITFQLTLQHAINLSKVGKQSKAFDELSTVIPYLSTIPHSHLYHRHFEECCGLLCEQIQDSTQHDVLLSQEKCNATSALVSRLIMREEAVDGKKGSNVEQLQLETLLKEAMLQLSRQDAKEKETKRHSEEGKDSDSVTARTVDEYILQTSVDPGLFLLRSAMNI